MSQSERTVRCKVVGSTDVHGEVVYSEAPFNFYLTDPETSKVIEEGHPMEGKALRNKIVVLSSGKGSSVVQVDGLYQLKLHHNTPAGLVILSPEPTMVSAAFVSEVTLATGIDRETFRELKHAKSVYLSVKERELRFTV